MPSIVRWYADGARGVGAASGVEVSAEGIGPDGGGATADVSASSVSA